MPVRAQHRHTQPTHLCPDNPRGGQEPAVRPPLGLELSDPRKRGGPCGREGAQSHLFRWIKVRLTGVSWTYTPAGGWRSLPCLPAFVPAQNSQPEEEQSSWGLSPWADEKRILRVIEGLASVPDSGVWQFG